MGILLSGDSSNITKKLLQKEFKRKFKKANKLVNKCMNMERYFQWPLLFAEIISWVSIENPMEIDHHIDPRKNWNITITINEIVIAT